MKTSEIDGPAYSAMHRVLGGLCLVVALVSLWAVVPIAIKRFESSWLDGVFFGGMVVVFAFLALLGVDRVTAKVSLASDGLAYRGLWRRARYDWSALRAARTISVKGVLYYIVGDGSRREIWVPCADSRVRAAIGEARVGEAIREKG